MRNVLKRIFSSLVFFFQFLLVFELWSIFYSTVVNSEIGTLKIFEPENLIQKR